RLLALAAVGAGKLGTTSASPSITLAFAAASRLASISLINSILRSICSVVIALMPPDCSTCISRGTNKTSNFKNIAGLFFITLSMAFAPPRRKALCSSAMVSAFSAFRARSGLPPGFPILQKNFNFDMAGTFAILIILSLIGVGLHALIGIAQRRFVFWMDMAGERVIGA